MKKYTTLLVCCYILSFFGACNTTKKIAGTKKEGPKIQLTAVFAGCEGDLGLYQFDGIDFQVLQNIGTKNRDTFYFKVPAGNPQFYYVGANEAQKRPVILGSEKNVFVTGTCKNMRQAKILNSPLNKDYDELLQTFNTQKGSSSKAVRSFQMAGKDAQKQQSAIAEMAKIDQEKLNLLESLKQNNPFISKIAALNVYLSFHNHNNGRFNNEVEYFANTYFERADLSDSDYNEMPYVFEAFKGWSKVLIQQRIPDVVLQGLLDSTLVRIPNDSKTLRYALGGIVTAMQSGNHPLFSNYGNRYLALFSDKKNTKVQALQQKIDLAGSFVTGAVAPDFTQKTPEGEDLSLSDLRGKVVLVDFWASWCGPCRKENPNVKRVYEKYKDKGFDILGVSLDRTKKSWVKAIEKDGLPWHQISDLKGWKNEVAQLYSVSSIPHTILLDQEGRILARNLRGHELEGALGKIFGE